MQLDHSGARRESEVEPYCQEMISGSENWQGNQPLLIFLQEPHPLHDDLLPGHLHVDGCLPRSHESCLQPQPDQFQQGSDHTIKMNHAYVTVKNCCGIKEEGEKHFYIAIIASESIYLELKPEKVF